MNHGTSSRRLSVRGQRFATTRTFIEPLQRRIFLDATAPVVTHAAFVFDAFPTRQTITLKFNENVAASLVPQDFILVNLTARQGVPQEAFDISFDAATNTASIRFDGSLPSHALSDGNYQLTVQAGCVKDAAGTPLANDFMFNFFAFTGDANHDRTVDTLDFNALDANFGGKNKTFSQGDFNYDGVADTLDFNTLAGQFGKTLPPAAASAAAPSASGVQATASLSPRVIGDDGTLIAATEDLPTF